MSHFSTFKVGTRQLSLDLATASAEHAPRELGEIPTSRLLEIAQQLTQFGPGQSADSDPHLIVSARRGRFIVRPGHGALRLFDAADPSRAFLELTCADLPSYLDETDHKSVEPVLEISSPGEIDRTQTRMGLVAALFGLSAAVLVGSAYFTFRESSIDPDAEYSKVPSEQIPALRQQFLGTFATGSGEFSRELTLRNDGHVTLLEHGRDNSVADKRDDAYTFALHHGATPTARTMRLGPIQLQDAKTLLYAGETYTRQP